MEVVNSGHAAAARLEEDDSFDVILCDFVMEDGTGEELLEWLEGHRPRLVKRLAFVSGMAHPDGAALTNRPVLKKPFNIAELRRLAKTLARDE